MIVLLDINEYLKWICTPIQNSSTEMHFAALYSCVGIRLLMRRKGRDLKVVSRSGGRTSLWFRNFTQISLIKYITHSNSSVLCIEMLKPRLHDRTWPKWQKSRSAASTAEFPGLKILPYSNVILSILMIPPAEYRDSLKRVILLKQVDKSKHDI